MPTESYVVSLLVKLAAMASIASILARSNRFKSILLEEKRNLGQRFELALWLSVVFGSERRHPNRRDSVPRRPISVWKAA